MSDYYIDYLNLDWDFEDLLDEEVEKEDVLSVPEIYDNDGNLCNCGICKPTSEGNEV